MYYTVYKITNIKNNYSYIGVHKTNDLNDDYMGSGRRIKAAIKKHGAENFIKELLAVYDNPKEMFDLEAQLVTEDFVDRKDTYNIKTGGHGGFDHINSTGKNLYGMNGRTLNCVDNFERGRATQRHLRETNPEWVEKTKHNMSEAARKAREKYGNGFKGKKHTKETLDKMKGHDRQCGKKNSQFGSRWICNVQQQINKKIKRDEPIPLGWVYGKNKWKKIL